MSEVSGVVLARAARRGTAPLDNERRKALNDDKAQRGAFWCVAPPPRRTLEALFGTL